MGGTVLLKLRSLLRLYRSSIVFSLALALAWPLLYNFKYFWGFDLLHYDLAVNLFTNPDVPDDVLMVAVDEPTFQVMGKRWPLPLEAYTKAADKALAGGAKAVGIDVYFYDDFYRDDDSAFQQFQQLVRERPEVVLADRFEADGTGISPILFPRATRGYPNLAVDEDGVVRSLRLKTEISDTTRYPLAVRMAAAAQHVAPDSLIDRIPQHDGYAYFSAYGRPVAVRRISLAAFNQLPTVGPLVKDKHVIVGAMYHDSKDFTLTSFARPLMGTWDREYGVTLHAWVLQTLLDGSWIKHHPESSAWWIAIPCVLIGLALALTDRIHVGMLGVLVFQVIVFFLQGWLLAEGRIWTSGSSVIFASGFSWAGASLIRLMTVEKARTRIEGVLKRHITTPVFEELLRKRKPLNLGGEQRYVSVLFSDIRGFTAWSEELEPHDVVSELNEYFESQVRVAERCGGVVNKFIGDALMVFFGEPFSRGAPEPTAVRAAIDMQRALAAHNQRRKALGKTPLQIGIGIASGPALMGTIGSSSRQEYTAIGKTVNLAARLSGVAQPGEILLCPTTSDEVGDEILREARETYRHHIALKGFSDSIATTAMVMEMDRQHVRGEATT
ncbi:CHASE2 domain-containing protein [bacterium]|nr:CHASE2 domain-containing protein [bacterium]